MISFCQDLSISYEYHIYENKTIKKITHTRNGSNLSEKTTVKTNKLSLVSKKTSHNKSLHTAKGISLTDSGKHDDSSPKHRDQHKRHFSNHSEMRALHVFEPKQSEPRIPQKDIDFTSKHEVKSIELHQVPFHQRVHFNRPQLLRSINPQEKPSIISTQSPTMPSYSFVQSAKHFTEQSSPFKNCEIHQSQTIQINGSIQRLNQSMQTRKLNFESKPYGIQNHSHTNSFASYETLIKFGKSNLAESETQDDKKSQKRGINVNREMNLLTPKFIPTKVSLEKDRFNNMQHSFSEHKGLEYKIILPQNKFNPENFYEDQNSPLFDAASIVSKTLNDEELDDESLSIVEQRNFFFEKEEEPNRAFKKSIEKFIFFEAGYTSKYEKWVLFKNVQERDNRKIYSIKEFPAQYEREYFNEYDIYLSLKTQTSQQYSGKERNSSIQCVFLQLFNALSNNEERKLHLVKQSFEFLLHDYICHLKMKHTLTIDRIRILVGQKSKIEKEIEEIFELFGSKDISIREDEKLEIEDFVICKDFNGNFIIKFHSLHKLEKGQKMHKVLKKQFFSSKTKQTKEKIEELYQKIHSVFFYECSQ